MIAPASKGPIHEVENPIINDAHHEPEHYWMIRSGEPAVKVNGRRPSSYYYTPEKVVGLVLETGESGTAEMLDLVNDIRKRVDRWRRDGYPGVTRTTAELLAYWTRPDRRTELFFCQVEAAETIIFLTEARMDYRQGLDIPLEELSENAQATGLRAFRRYACKMATGAGKTMVMAMIIAWSVLNKAASRQDSRFSDGVLVVCPNITIRERLRELDPAQNEASTYRIYDLVPPQLMSTLWKGRIVVTNWHILQPQEGDRVGGAAAKVVKIGMESDTALLRRVLGRGLGNKGHLLVINDEAHHAYRKVLEDAGARSDDELEEMELRESTVWIEGLDKVHKARGINFCVDFSATPFFLKATGRDVGRPFPWIVSDFGLIDAIESGLVKIPQFPIEDTTAGDRATYFNLWRWIVEKKLSTSEKGGKRGQVKPEAVLRYAIPAITQLAEKWRETFREWQSDKANHPTPPVFVIVCKNTALAKKVHEWLLGKGESPAMFPEFWNEDGREYTVRIDSKVVEELESGELKDNETKRLRYVLRTIGKTRWPGDLVPEEWSTLAQDLTMDPTTPPGRDVRCIVSVAMLTEGWDANTVTHILGLRPFQSQLLCEQIVGRGLRRTQYEDLFAEEVAVVLGVPFEVIPFKAKSLKGPAPPKPVYHVHPVEERGGLEIRFPRVEGYTFRARHRIKAVWDQIPPLVLDPAKFPAKTRVKDYAPDALGRISSFGPGRENTLTFQEFRREHRIQELEYEIARTLTADLDGSEFIAIPRHALFPQCLAIAREYLRTKVVSKADTAVVDVLLNPYFDEAVNRIREALGPDPSSERTPQGDRPQLPRYERSRPAGSTKEMDYWTSRKVIECRKSHLNLAPIDSGWEQIVKFALEEHVNVVAWARNYNLGFAIPYLRGSEVHDYIPDFLLRLQWEGREVGTMILEVKGGQDEWAPVKEAAARRWVAAVTEEGTYGRWEFAMVREPTNAAEAVTEAAQKLAR
jgi:type III restriction enzyme